MIDVVYDEVFCDDPVRVSPVSRLVVGDLATADYLLYPIDGTIADKICAITEFHDGRPPSRMKDLVDLAIIFSTQTIGECRRLCSFELARLMGRTRSFFTRADSIYQGKELFPC